jgi:L-threonylcarbamoyladenylate synthase
MAIVSRRYDCSVAPERVRAIAQAVTAVRRGQLVVLPTDTVYGIGCDAFKPDAVKALLDAKGRGRDMPAPVLVGSVRAAEALIEDLGTYGQDLVDEFWPGALTIVCKASSTLAWDLGDAKGTVAVRMPLHPLALEVLKKTGPLAVSSANISGSPPARTAKDAETQLGDSVDVYLDDGPTGDELPSSIVDLTGTVPRLLRAGAISEVRLREVCGVLVTDEEPDTATDEETPGTDDGHPAGEAGTTGEDAPEATGGGTADGVSGEPPSRPGGDPTSIVQRPPAPEGTERDSVDNPAAQGSDEPATGENASDAEPRTTETLDDGDAPVRDGGDETGDSGAPERPEGDAPRGPEGKAEGPRDKDA